MSKIEWTEKTWNPITGCTKASAGCKNCYAETIANRFWGDRKFTDVQFHENRLNEPIKRKKPTKYFVNSMSDLFHEEIDIIDVGRILNVMGVANKHLFQVLTKRPERMSQIINHYYKIIETEPYKNLWLGVSVEDQKSADIRCEHLKNTNAEIRWVSYEPALAEVDWTGWEFIDWIVVGGESGQKKRSHNADWFRKTKQWADDNKIKFFMKQMDKLTPIPNDLMVRDYPVQNTV